MPPKTEPKQSETSRPKSIGGNAATKKADGDLNYSLAEFGIVAVPSMRFEWGGYQYTNATDAIAAAKRAASK